MNTFGLIESIRELNPSASIEFLSSFSQRDLDEYLDRLLELESTKLSPSELVLQFDKSTYLAEV